ncbi:MAG: universal stress protein [Flammeovirgaceae bacterium]|nr:universal stress protein [Flammeovirgaceae bacterium]
MFKRIALAFAFSPRMEALLAEAVRLQKLWNAELLLIHVGIYGEEQMKSLQRALNQAGSDLSNVTLINEEGKPSERILHVCKTQNVDLLIAGALKKENLVKYYLGTVALKILRKANCSVLMLVKPSEQPAPYQHIVINAEDSPYVEDALRVACYIGIQDQSSWLHVIREIKMYGFTMSATQQGTEKEYDQLRHDLVRQEVEMVEKMLAKIQHDKLKVNIKMLSGKSGFELAKFAERKHADLLVVGAPPRRFSLFDRVFPHDLEYIFADMPCNLLVVHPAGKEQGHA